MNTFFKAIDKKFTLEEIAELTDSTVGSSLSSQDQKDVLIENIASLEKANATNIAFFANPQYLDQLKKTKAGACFISKNYVSHLPSSCVAMVSQNPYASYARLLNIFFPRHLEDSYISENALIAKSAKIGKNVTIKDGSVIGENVVIGDNTSIGYNTVIYDGVEIGKNTKIHSSVSIKYAKIGANVVIYDGVRIGQKGFGYAAFTSGHIPIRHVGDVVIEDEVEIGANSCIDRAVFESTIVGKGTKIDNLVQIAHNVEIGKHCVLAAQAGIAGSTKIGDFVSVAGQAATAPHLKVGNGASLGPKTGAWTDIKEKEVVMGYPAVPYNQFWRHQVILKQLSKNHSKK